MMLESEANMNDHWTRKAKRTKKQKFVVTAFLKAYLKKAFAPCVVKFTRYSPRPYDNDNIIPAFKYVRDAVSEYILGQVDNKVYRAGRADGDKRIRWEYRQEKTKDAEHYITIQIEPSYHMQDPTLLSENQVLLVDL